VEESDKDAYMNGFSYDEDEKKIRITDTTTVVVWENVEKNVAEEAAKMYGKSESIDDFLIKHNCKRYWGNNIDATTLDTKIE
jgi:hypothetical protein